MSVGFLYENAVVLITTLIILWGSVEEQLKEKERFKRITLTLTINTQFFLVSYRVNKNIHNSIAGRGLIVTEKNQLFKYVHS